MRTTSNGFFKDNFHYIVACAGIVAVFSAIVFRMPGITASSYDTAMENENDIIERQSRMLREREAAVEIDDSTVTRLDQSFTTFKAPGSVDLRPAKVGNFLVSCPMIFCPNTKYAPRPVHFFPTPPDGNIEGLQCMICGFSLEKPPPPKPADTDGDGLPDAWESEFGLNPKDGKDAALDADGDGFTNAEEFAAGTNPADPESHSDYASFFVLASEPFTTYVPFNFMSVVPLRNGDFRVYCEILNDRGQAVRRFTATKGCELEVDDSSARRVGYIAVDCLMTNKVVSIKGSGSDASMVKEIPAHELTLERKKDGKRVVMKIGNIKTPIDIKGSIRYTREASPEFEVVAGTKFKIHGREYVVERLEPAHGASSKPYATVLDEKTGTRYKIQP